MLLPMLLWMTAGAARRTAGRGAPAAAAAAAPASAAPVVRVDKVDNYVLRVRDPGAGAPAQAAETRPAPAAVQPASVSQPASGAAVPLEVVLGRLPSTQRAWVALELLGPPLALRDDQRDPW